MSPSRPIVDEAAHVRALRDALPAVTRRTYLNAGTAGPMLRSTAEVLAREIERELFEGRAEIAGFERLLEKRDELRARYARLMGATPNEIALTRHTTDGINVVLWGLNWQPGDELLTTSLEHEAAIVPAATVARRFGADLRVAELGAGDDPDRVVEAIGRALGPRTRALLVSHVAWNTGAVLPLRAIVERAHAAGALVLVDGAQSVGAMPVDVRALGADFYTASGQKWLLGPEGEGALFVRQDRLSLVRQTFSGYLSLRDFDAWSLAGDLLPAPGARRFEVGTSLRPSIHAMAESLRFLDEDVGLAWAHSRIHANARKARERIAAIPGARLVTREEGHAGTGAGLVAFTIAGRSSEEVVRELALRDVIIRHVPLDGASVLRASCGFFTDEHDLDRLAAALGEVRA